jgi:hypothetical protein
MTRLTWEPQDYEVGIDQGVFYPKGGPAEPWNGLVSVNENILDATESAAYQDGMRQSHRQREASFSASIITYAYPPSFFVTPRSLFGFSYRTKTSTSYKIHLVYNALAHLSGQKHAHDDSSPISLDISTIPVPIIYAKPSAHLVLDAASAYPPALVKFESVIYGDDSVDARLPLPDEVFDIFDVYALYKIVDNGDGTYTMDAPDEIFAWLDASTVDVNWPNAVFVDDESYIIRSW